jgi:hypothetical protein
MRSVRWRASAGLVLLFVLPLAVGCAGGHSRVSQADRERGREALRTGLEAWRNGRPAEDLAAGRTPIYFNDPRWTEGTVLTAYRLEEADEFHGFSLRCAAVLSLRDGHGSTAQKRVTYLIDTDPRIVIVPGDL